MRRLVSALRTPILVALVLGALPGPALVRAQPTEVPRAVVLRFEGWRATRARRAVVRELASHVELVDESRAVGTAEELGVDVSTPDGMAQVVEHLGISLVVAGEVAGRGRRAQTTIYVTDAQGEALSQATGPAPLRRRQRREIAQAAVQAIQEAQAVLQERAAAAEAAAAAAAEPEPRPAVPIEEPEPEPEAPGWRQPIILGLVGLRFRTAGTYVGDADEPLRQHFFEADMYPEIDLFVLARPWARENDDLRGILFGLQGSFSVGLSYTAFGGEERGMQSLRFRLDAGYGYVVEDLVEIIGMLGFGLEGVQLEDPDGFPSTLFSYLRPAVMGRLRAVPDFVIVEAGIGGRIGLDAGELTGAYGALSYGGVDLFLGLSGTVEPGFSWAARFGYSFMALGIDSSMGGNYDNGDGGTDETIDLRLLVGWAY